MLFNTKNTASVAVQLGCGTLIQVQVYGEVNQPKAIICPPLCYSRLQPKALAERVLASVCSLDDNPCPHVALAVADIPYGVCRELWDKPWGSGEVTRMTKWLIELVEFLNPNSQVFTLVIFCSWM